MYLSKNSQGKDERNEMPNRALHRTPLRSAGELYRYRAEPSSAFLAG